MDPPWFLRHQSAKAITPIKETKGVLNMKNTQDIKLIGLDLAKEIFQVHGINDRGEAILKKQLKRNEMLEFFINLKPLIVAMEACGGSNYWARKLKEMGHEPRLISAQYVKPFVKSQKNDKNDAEAIAEAASRPSMRYVKPKEIWQQDIQALHRVRNRLVTDLTALMNQVRGIMLEYGLTMPIGASAFTKQIPEILENGDNELTSNMREVLRDLYEEYYELLARKNSYDKRISNIVTENQDCKRLLKIPGIGPLTSTMFVAALGDPSSFKNGREVSAWLGLVPRQISSGGKTKLLGITKRGDVHLRSLLVHGARSHILSCHKKKIKSANEEKILKLVEQKGYNKTAVAIANKNARMMWAIVKNKDEYKIA